MLVQLKEDLKNAMKAKDVVKRDILRFIVSQIKNKQIDSHTDVTDDEIVKIMKKEIKQIDETVESLLKNWSSTDDISTEERKKSILSAYLPEMFSEEKTRQIVLSMIESTWIDLSEKRWQLIGMIMKEYWSSIDWKLLNTIVNSI